MANRSFPPQSMPTIGVRDVRRAVLRGELAPSELVRRGRPSRYVIPVPHTRPGARPAGVSVDPRRGAGGTGHVGYAFVNPRDGSSQLARTEFEGVPDRGYVIIAGFSDERKLTRETFGDDSLRQLARYEGLRGDEAMARLAASFGAPREPGVAAVYSLMLLADAIQTQAALADDPFEAGKSPASRRWFGDYWSATYHDFVRSKVTPVDGRAFGHGFGQHYEIAEELDAVLITSDDGGDLSRHPEPARVS